VKSSAAGVPPNPREGRLLTTDGVDICATYRPAPQGVPHDPVIVVGHGFTGFRAKADNLRIAERLNQHLAVVDLDYRGHGSSGGTSSLGMREVLDLDAAIAWARDQGHQKVVSLGFSMGSAIAVRQAALTRTTDRGPLALTAENAPDAVVSVSGTAFWFYRGTAPMRLVHRAVSTPVGRAVLARVSHTRVDVGDWEAEELGYSPEEAAAYLAPIPFLLVHGDADTYFPLEHPEAVHRGAVQGARDRGFEPKIDLWIEPGFAHAEAAVDDELLDRICAWALSMAGGETS